MSTPAAPPARRAIRVRPTRPAATPAGDRTRRHSQQSRYDYNLATYDSEDPFDQSLAKGFIDPWGPPGKIAADRDQG